MSFQIETEFTPNPHALKFNTGKTLLATGTANFSTREAAEKSPLAKKIFGVRGIEGVFIGHDFVTISRNPGMDTWGSLISPVTHILKTHLETGEPIVSQGWEHSTVPESGSDIEKKIRKILDERVRPAVARDGGDILFQSYKEGVVSLHLQGSCSSCPSSTATLKAGVERMLREYVPEIKEVIQV